MLFRSQEVFDAALAAGLADSFTYTSLVDAWGKSGDAVRAQEVFDAALAAGLANAFTYTSLVDACKIFALHRFARPSMLMAPSTQVLVV